MQPDPPEETEVEIESWRAWFDRICRRLRDTGGDNPLSGYNIIHDESIDKAIEMAKACPIISDGSIEVAEFHEVSM